MGWMTGLKGIQVTGSHLDVVASDGLGVQGDWPDGEVL